MDAPDLAADARVRAVLLRVKPTIVRVFQADGEHRDLAVPTRKNRWSAVGKTLSQLGWVRLELLDRKGQLVEIVENDGPTADLEDLVPTRGAREFDQVERYVSLLGRMQDQAVARMAQMFAPAFEALREALRITSQREQATMTAAIELQQLVEALWDRLERGTPAAAAAAGPPKKTLSGQVLEHIQDELAPAIAQEVARSAMSTFGVKPPPSKPNGHNPPPPSPKIG